MQNIAKKKLWSKNRHKLSQKQLSVAKQLYYYERLSFRQVAQALHVSHMTVWRELARIPASEMVTTDWARQQLQMV